MNTTDPGDETLIVTGTPRLDAVDREWIIRGAWHLASRKNKRCVLWSFVGRVCSVGSTSATMICKELGWNPHAKATAELPHTKKL